MSLEDLDIKFAYDSDEDDITNNFYIPALSTSTKYFRLSGFFTSKTLAIAARGMEKFIKNQGKMELICSAKLNEKDIEMIKKAHADPLEIIEESLIKELDDIQNEFQKDHVAALGWMLVHGQLKIKIALVRDKYEQPVMGLFHQKIGIFIDKEGNSISFSGSDNETGPGLKENIEEFKVFKSWEEGTSHFVKSDKKTFEKFWTDSATRTKIYNIPEAVEQKIIERAPKEITSLNLSNYYNNNKSNSKIKLYKHQKEAIQTWFDHDNKGIFNMATGTGKTLTALGCLKKLTKEKDNFLTVIACPQSHLITQWEKDVNKCITNDTLITGSTNYHWRDELKDLIKVLNFDIVKFPVVLTTHKTLSSNDFITRIKDFTGDILLIVDEMHGIGSKENKFALIDQYNYRLGLSATPDRWYDEEGTKFINDYFGGCIYSFDLELAIKKGYLTPYIYKPIFVDLDEEELEEYLELSNQIAKLVFNKNHDEKRLTLLLNKRQSIINNAAEKYFALRKLLNENKGLRDLLVYCSPQQISNVQKILNENGFTQHKFTGKEGTRKDTEYGNLTERDFILKNFAKGKYQALVAMRCLDEGVDIPSAKTAILMSSTSNPREHIQRRGRILRTFKGKDLAIIHDLIVHPIIKNMTEAEKNILKKEKIRYNEFANSAKNAAECSKLLIDKWGL
ncbi:MAG: DEAD/DEAH box helicase family protein [Methanobacteriaceae archaeon]|nr:DEAD/DEAH box helicase family protein [Methanobacteriaceae archaeon]